MLVPALIIMLANLTGYMYPPLAKVPVLQAMTLPLSRSNTPITLSVPPCTYNPLVSEGELVPLATNLTLLCRGISDGSTTNQSFPLTQYTYNGVQGEWSLTQTLGDKQPFSPNVGSAGLKFAQSQTGETWGVLQAAGSASGGTAGNGGSSTFWYFPAPYDPVGPPPTAILDSARGTTVLDLQMTQQGMFALARKAPPPTGSPGIGVIESGLLFWPVNDLPKRPADGFPWLPGTNSSRLISSFYAPSEGAYIVALYISPSVYPVVVEQWRLDTTTGIWARSTTIPVTSLPSAPLQIIGFQGGLVLMGTQKLVLLTSGATGTWTETVVSNIQTTPSLQFRSVAPGVLQVTPTPSALPSYSSTATYTASASATSTSSATASSTSSATSSSTSSASATSSATITASSTATFSRNPVQSPPFTESPVPTYSSFPTTSPQPGASSRPGPGSTLSLTPSPSLSHSPSPTGTNGTAPIGPQPDNSQSNSLTIQEKLGLGFGLTSAGLVILAFLLGCFARQAMFNTFLWIKKHILRQKLKPKQRHPTRLSAIPTAPGVVHLSMNPALLQQQSALELLQLAREQRLEAIQAQKEQTVAEQPRMDRLKSFKKVYKPMMVPGTGPGASV